MNTRQDAGLFLQSFQAKLGRWGVIFREWNSQNLESLFELGISREERRSILSSLVVSDYSEGPMKESLYNMDLWVFGKRVNEKEIYIKVALGMPEAETICLSFCNSLRHMNYPLKTSTK